MPSPFPAVRAWLLALLCITTLSATTVVAPTFPELVAEAQTIVRGRVTGVESRWIDTPQGRVIKTYVTFTVLRALKGAPGATLTLQLLGGEVAGEGMRVAGMPQFAVGDTDIVFVAGNGVSFSPLVGLMHGRYRVQRDATSGQELVTRNDRAPLTNVDDVRLPQRETPLPATLALTSALTVDAFETRIAQEISRHATLP